MGNPSTRAQVLGHGALPQDVLPGRSPGSLGWKDAADPDGGMCVDGDTPSPVGTGADGGDLLCSACAADEAPGIVAPVLTVDVDRLSRMLYGVAHAEAVERAATRGFGSAEVTLGEDSQITAAARRRADELTQELYEAMLSGPEAVRGFLAEQEQDKLRAEQALQKKFSEALATGQRWTNVLGGAVKVLSVVKFASTATVKVVSVFTGFAGTGIDIAYSAAQDGLAAGRSQQRPERVLGVVADSVGEDVGAELAAKLNELVASGIMTKQEKDYLRGALGNYKGNRAKIAEQLLKVERRIQIAIERGRSSKRLLEEQAKKLAKLRALRQRTLQGLATKGAGGLAKRALGHGATIYFLATDLAAAWDEMRGEWATSQ